VPAAPPRAARILHIIIADQRALDAQQLEHARHRDVEPLEQQPLVQLQATEHRLRAEPVERLEPVSELSARHARAPRAVVVVRVADRAPSCGRRALVVLLAQPALQVVRQLLYQIAACDADGPVRRADIDDPGKHTRDDAELGHAGKCCGLLPAVRPRAVGGVCGTVAVRGREQHVPAEMRSLFVADWDQKRIDLWCRCNSLYLHHFQNGAICTYTRTA